MDKGVLWKPDAPRPDGPLFARLRDNLVVRLILISMLAIFLLETLVMLLLQVISLPEPWRVLLDGALLAVILFPLTLFLLVRPLAEQTLAHRQAKLKLAWTTEVLERFFSITDIHILYLDARFRIIRVNAAYASASGRPAASFTGQDLFALFPSPEHRPLFEAARASGRAHHGSEQSLPFIRPGEASPRYWDWSLLPVRGADGQVEALILVLNDVTNRKQAELALVESEHRFRAAFNQTFQHAILLDPSGQVLLANQTALDFTGAQAGEVAGRPLWELPWWQDEETARSLEAAARQAAGGAPARRQHWVRPASGDPARLHITLKPLLDEGGGIRLLIYEASDITGYIQAQEDLQRKQEEINRLYQAEKRAHDLAERLRAAALALSGSLSLYTVLETLLDHLQAAIPYTSAHVALYEDERQLSVITARGEEEWDPRDRLLDRRLDAAELTSLQAILAGRRAAHVPDTGLDPDSRFLPTERWVRSWLGLPLLAGDQVIGLCLLEHTCPGFFTRDMAGWASAFSSQAGVAIQNAWLFEQVQEARQHLQALSRRLVEAHESERHYIARELHDEAGQALASLKMSLRLLERDSCDPERVAGHCRQLKEIADGVMENLHRLAVDLRPAVLDHIGLQAALQQYTETVSQQHSLAVQFAAVGAVGRLPDEVETAVYRIVQEALTNVVRHARASQASVLLEARHDALIVVVEDNGVGFEPHTPCGDHLGLLGMRERADMLGGALTVESAPGKGSTLVLEVPWPSAS